MMTTLEQTQELLRLINENRSDEELERLTGLSLLDVIELRAAAASQPLQPGVFPPPAYEADRLAERRHFLS